MTRFLKALSRKTKSVQRGMTLIEIMVVIAIIGIVAGAVGFGVTRYLSDAKVDAAKAQLANIATHITSYYARNGEWPDSLDVLTQKDKGKKALLKESQLQDPWKTAIKYEAPSGDSEEFKLCSAGPDKRDGGDDDICHEE